MPRPRIATSAEVEQFLLSAPAWAQESGVLVRTATAATFPAAIAWVNEVAIAAEAADHHPDIDIRWRTVTFHLSTHDVGGITELDFALAREIDRIVA